jgi:hypothetical protein
MLTEEFNISQGRNQVIYQPLILKAGYQPGFFHLLSIFKNFLWVGNAGISRVIS